MSIITVASTKGGAGKSTLASNLFAYHLSEGKGGDALLVDTDIQKSLTSWAAIRQDDANLRQGLCIEKTGKDIHVALTNLTGKYETIFVDVPGNASMEFRGASLVADVLVYPVRPSNFDAWVFNNDLEVIEQLRIVNQNLRVLIVFNGLSCLSNIQAGEARMLRSYLANYSGFEIANSVICNRPVFSSLVGGGRGIADIVGNPISDVDIAALAEAKAKAKAKALTKAKAKAKAKGRALPQEEEIEVGLTPEERAFDEVGSLYREIFSLIGGAQNGR